MLLCALMPLSALAQSVSDLMQSISAPPDERQVVDDANALFPGEEAMIAEVIDRIERDHQVDVVVLVTNDAPMDYTDELYYVQNFADDWYERGGYGLGPDHSGMLYLIDLKNRVQYISTEGVMIDYISDYREGLIFDAAEYDLMNGEWGGAALAAMEQTARLMDQGRENGSFRYDEVTGQRLSGYHNALLGHEILIAVGGGAAVAAIFIGVVAGAYGLKGGTYKYDLAANSDCSITRDDEQYLRESVSRIARGSSSHGGGGGSRRRSGGSGVHRSSSGRSHGGGGRRF